MKAFKSHLVEKLPYTTHGYWMDPQGELYPVDKGEFRAKAEELSYGEGINFLQNNGWMKMVADGFELRVVLPRYITKAQRNVISLLTEHYIMMLKIVVMWKRNGDAVIDSRKGGTVKEVLKQWQHYRENEL